MHLPVVPWQAGKNKSKFINYFVTSPWAGGVAQYLLEEGKHKYDLFLGTSTGSLLISQLTNGEIKRAHEIYTNVDQSTIYKLSQNLNQESVRKKSV